MVSLWLSVLFVLTGEQVDGSLCLDFVDSGLSHIVYNEMENRLLFIEVCTWMNTL